MAYELSDKRKNEIRDRMALARKVITEDPNKLISMIEDVKYAAKMSLRKLATGQREEIYNLRLQKYSLGSC